MELNTILSALGAINPSINRQEWVKISFALKSANCDFSVFHNWSKTASNYRSEKDCRTAWNSAKTNGNITPSYIYRMAQNKGWRNPGDKPQNNNFLDDPVDWFNSLPPFTIDHPYIKDQGLDSKLNGHETLLRLGKDKNGTFIADPIYNVSTDVLEGFNRIYGKGGDNKKIAPKTKKQGNAGIIGKVTNNKQHIYVTEGMADALHAHNIYNAPTFIANDAGNIEPVTKAICKKYPSNPITIIADNDITGIEAALKATSIKGNVDIRLPLFYKDVTDMVLAGNNEVITISGKPTLKDCLAIIEAKIIDSINNASTTNNSIVENWVKTAVKFDLKNKPSTYPKFIKAVQSKTDLTKGEIKKAVNSAYQQAKFDALKKSGTDSALVGFNLDGNPALIEHSKAAKILSEISPIISNLRFDDISDKWMGYESNCWDMTTDARVDRFIKQAIEQQAGDIGFNTHYLKGVKDLIKTEIIHSKWDGNKNLLNLQNGVLDLSNMNLLKHTKSYHSTSQLPFSYNPQADCPITRQFLLECVGNDEGQRQILRAYMNAIIKGRADLQRCLVIVGMGGTGKGAFMRLCTSLVGQRNLHTTNFKHLEGSTGRFDVGKLYRKKLLLIPDADQYTGSVETFKSVTGQDSLRYEEKNKNNDHNGNFIFQGMAIIASNEPLAVNDHTSGWKRRILNLTFDNAFNKRDGNLGDKLEAELPGILNWVLELTDEDVTDLVKNTDKIVSSARELKFKALVESNPFAAWAHDNLILETNNITQVGSKEEIRKTLDNGESFKAYQYQDERLYPNYLKWCDENGRKAQSLNRFSNLLEQLFKSPDLLYTPNNTIRKNRTGKHGTHFIGLAIRSDNDTATPSPVDIAVMSF